jgi:hypothetical protein
VNLEYKSRDNTFQVFCCHKKERNGTKAEGNLGEWEVDGLRMGDVIRCLHTDGVIPQRGRNGRCAESVDTSLKV